MSIAEAISGRSAFHATTGQVAWDSSSFNLYAACPRKYLYSQVYGWRPRLRDPHLTFGGYAASALAHYFDRLAAGTGRAEAVHSMIRFALTESANWHSLHESKHRESLIRTLVWYTTHYANDNMRVAVGMDGQAQTERSFAAELSSSFVWCGHIDQLVEIDGQFYIRDQKTSGSALTSTWFRQWDLSNQMSGYALAGKTFFSVAVIGVVIDAIQVGASFTRFARGFTFRSPTLLREWVSDVLTTLKQARDAFLRVADGVAEPEAFPRNLTACGMYGGCQFRSVCSRSQEVREQFLAADFERVVWDPLAGSEQAAGAQNG